VYKPGATSPPSRPAMASRSGPISTLSPPPWSAPPGPIYWTKRLLYTAGLLPQPRPSPTGWRFPVDLVHGSSTAATSDPITPAVTRW